MTPVAPPRPGAAPPAAPARPGVIKQALARNVSPWLWLAPALLLFAAFKFVPMVRAVRMSFTEVRP